MKIYYLKIGNELFNYFTFIIIKNIFIYFLNDLIIKMDFIIFILKNNLINIQNIFFTSTLF